MVNKVDILSIEGEKMFGDYLLVKKVGQDVYRIVGFNYGEEEERFTGFAEETATYINQYYGYSE